MFSYHYKTTNFPLVCSILIAVFLICIGTVSTIDKQIEIDRWMDRETDKQTDRERKTHTYIHIHNIQTDMHEVIDWIQLAFPPTSCRLWAL